MYDYHLIVRSVITIFVQILYNISHIIFLTVYDPKMTFPERAQKFSLGNLDFWGAFGATAPQYKSKIKVIQIAMYSIPSIANFILKNISYWHFL